MNNPTVYFFGNERLASGLPPIECQVLPALLRTGYELRAVVVQQKSVSSRRIRTLEIAQVAAEAQIPLLSIDKLTEHSSQETYYADIGILVAFGKMVSADLISRFRCGILNLHPSLLPLYRGPTPVEQALLDGCTTTGVSLMRLAAGMDNGPLLAQQSVDVTPTESKQQLARTLLMTGAQLIIDHLPQMLAGTAILTPQDNSRATFTSLVTKSDGRLSGQSLPAVVLERQVRAYSGWPGSYLSIGGKDVRVIEAQVSRGNLRPDEIRQTFEGDIALGTTQDILLIRRVHPAGKTEMESAAFVRGLPQKLPIL